MRTLRVEREGRLTVDVIGSHRRLQALATLGWSIPALERHAGCPHWKLHNVLYRRQGTRVERSTADLISSLYDELWDQEPPQATKGERQSAGYTKAVARKNGWAPPMAWYGIDIDDWDAYPRLDAEVPGDELFDWVKVERATTGRIDPAELSLDEKVAAAKTLMRRDALTLNAAAIKMGLRAETLRSRLAKLEQIAA